MTKTILVEVTTEDISLSDARDNSNCMIARALSRTTGLPWQCSTWLASYEGNSKSFRLPTIAEVKLRHQIYFVCGERSAPVEPFSFEFTYDDPNSTEESKR